MGIRNRARKFLLQARYAAELNDISLFSNLDTLGIRERFDEKQTEWISSLGSAVSDNRETIDKKITEVLKNWTLDRLSLLSKLILEQAIAEVLWLGIPAPVAIDEAIMLAREFETEKAGGFVNGVLARVFHQVLQRNGDTEQVT